jgi:hypothetical protein
MTSATKPDYRRALFIAAGTACWALSTVAAQNDVIKTACEMNAGFEHRGKFTTAYVNLAIFQA